MLNYNLLGPYKKEEFDGAHLCSDNFKLVLTKILYNFMIEKSVKIYYKVYLFK